MILTLAALHETDKTADVALIVL